jgi:hypothetical protein
MKSFCHNPTSGHPDGQVTDREMQLQTYEVYSALEWWFDLINGKTMANQDQRCEYEIYCYCHPYMFPVRNMVVTPSSL